MGKRYHAWVSGEVQGVGFRWYARRLAAGRAVSGWVRNSDDGRVEIVVEGEETEVQAFLTGIRTGHLGANITQVDIDEEPTRGESDGFRIIT